VIDHLTVERAKKRLQNSRASQNPADSCNLSFDPLEEDDLSEPHEVLADGSFLYTGGNRERTLFHPYCGEDILTCLLQD
jgi:hypothetical protein